MREFNLLATTSRGYEGYARRELRFLFEKIGDASVAVDRTGISGLLALKTGMGESTAIVQLRSLLQQSPYEFRYVLRIMPIERVVKTDLELIQDTTAELATKIKENETFRITVEKRFTMIHSKDIIEKVAKKINRTVNLSKPDKIVLIEILGGLTGISVATPDDILSVLKEKLL
jgi:tRNA acetyltransferase TAN1